MAFLHSCNTTLVHLSIQMESKCNNENVHNPKLTEAEAKATTQPHAVRSDAGRWDESKPEILPLAKFLVKNFM